MTAPTTTLATLTSTLSEDGTSLSFALVDHTNGAQIDLSQSDAVALSQALDAPTGAHGLETAMRTSIADLFAEQLQAQRDALAALGVPTEAPAEPAKPAARRRGRTTRAAAAEAEKAVQEPAPAPVDDAPSPEVDEAPAVETEPEAPEEAQSEPAPEQASGPEEPEAPKVTRGEQAEFEHNVNELASFHSTIGRWPSSSSQDADEKRLGAFLSNQRARGRSSAMSAERLELLDTVAPGWAGATATPAAVTPEPAPEAAPQTPPAAPSTTAVADEDEF